MNEVKLSEATHILGQLHSQVCGTDWESVKQTFKLVETKEDGFVHAFLDGIIELQRICANYDQRTSR